MLVGQHVAPGFDDKACWKYVQLRSMRSCTRMIEWTRPSTEHHGRYARHDEASRELPCHPLVHRLIAQASVVRRPKVYLLILVIVVALLVIARLTLTLIVKD
jgi:hypothetical protein